MRSAMTDVVGETVAMVVQPVEDVFDAFGLMQGPNAPFKRFAVTATLTGLAIWAARPDWAFQGGEPRPWSLMVGPQVREGAQPTSTPWWSLPVLVGVTFSFLI